MSILSVFYYYFCAWKSIIIINKTMKKFLLTLAVLAFAARSITVQEVKV